METTNLSEPEAEVSAQSTGLSAPKPDARGSPADPQPWDSPAVPASSSQAWWIHLWSGFARDPTAKHYTAMGNAIWLYLYLLISANRTDGTVWRRQDTIALQTGFSERSVARWLDHLRAKGYITSTTNGRSLRIVITKWRPISGGRSATNKN